MHGTPDGSAYHLAVYLLITSLIVLSAIASADTTGIVGGIVTDSDGDPLVGTTIMLEETGFGAISDVNGEFVIAGIPPGEYTVIATMVGRATARMESVPVLADRMSRVDFTLEDDPTGLTVITVQESRRNFLQDVPATMHLLDIHDAVIHPSMSIVDVISSQPGVVSRDGELHVRGGRAGELDYILDGVSLRSPITNTFNMELPTGALSGAALLTGGLGVEYGNSMSGVVNIVGDQGGDNYKGSLVLRRGDMTTASMDFGQRLFMEQTDNSLCRLGLTSLEVTLSGPEPLTEELLPRMGLRVPGKMTFSASGQISVSGRDTVDTRDRWENNWQTDVSGLAKLSYRPTNRTGFSLTAIGSYKERGWNEWDWSRFHLPAYIEGEAYLGRSQDFALPVRFGEGSGLIFNTTHLYGSSTSLKLTLGYTRFLDWHRIRTPQGDYLGEGAYPIYWLTQYAPEVRVQDSLGFYHTGIHPNVWFDSRANVGSARLDLDASPNTRLRVKAGISAEYYDLYQYNVYAESYGNIFVSQWDAYPHSGSAYLQGSYRFSGGLIATGGLRTDMFDANTSYFDDESGETKRVEVKWSVGPRVGISVPFGENSVFFTTYGKHFQMPSMDYLFLETSYNLAQDRIIAGNPDLDPQLTTAFEVGIRYYADEFTEFSLAAYLKDMTGLVSTRDNYQGTYYMFNNDDSHGTVRGIEVMLDRSAGSSISGHLSYTFSLARGKYSSALDWYNYAQSGVVYVSSEDNYLDWDQTHTAEASLELNTFQSQGPELAGLHPFENSTLALSWKYGSGVPYSLPPSTGELYISNSERYPFTMQTDITLSRTFQIASSELKFTAGVFNLFNRENIVHIYDTAYYRSTGLPGGPEGNARAWSPARHLLLSAGLTW